MTARPLHLTIYRDDTYYQDTHTEEVRTERGYRWTLQAANGKIIDASTESYTRRAGLNANLLLAHGLDVAGIKPGEMVVFKREITSWSRFGRVVTARPLHLTIYRSPTKTISHYAGGTIEKPTLTPVYHDGWRWTLKAANGKIIDASTESYTRRAGLDANLLQAHGLDVAGIKPGEMVVFKREITLWSRFGALAYTGQTIKVTVTP